MHNSRTFGLLGFDLRLISILDATTANEGRTSTLADTNWSLMTVTFTVRVLGVHTEVRVSIVELTTR